MVAALGLGIIPLVLWVVFAFFLYGALAPRLGGVRVWGEITGAREFLDRGRTMYVAEFRATVPDGRVLVGSGSISTSWQPSIGKRIALYYRGGASGETLVEASPVRFLAPLIVGVLALGFTGVVVAAVVEVVATPPPAAPSPHAPKKHGR